MNEMVNPGKGFAGGAMTKFSVPPSWWVDNVSEGEFVATYDTETKEGRRAVLRAMSQGCQLAKDRINTVLNAVHVVAHPYTSTDKDTGEMSERVRLVIIEEDGNCVQFVARTIVRRLALLSRLLRPMPWNPPLKLKLKSFTIPGGQGYELDPIEE